MEEADSVKTRTQDWGGGEDRARSQVVKVSGDGGAGTQKRGVHPPTHTVS
jgi:hypothetical protein